MEDSYNVDISKVIRIYSDKAQFTLGELSELLYSIETIYKLLVLAKEEKSISDWYFLQKIPRESAIYVTRISKDSPFFIDLSTTVTFGDMLQILAAVVIPIAIHLIRQHNMSKHEKRLYVERELLRKQIAVNEKLVKEIVKLSNRRLTIQEVEIIKKSN